MISKPHPRTAEVRMKQLVDWSAAAWAGVIAGSVFLLVNFFLTPMVVGGNGWIFIRLVASIPLGETVLAPPAAFDPLLTLVALAVHFALSVAFSMLLAYVVHRGGLLTGIVVGAGFGIALYLINFYTLTLAYPWFFAMRSWVFALAHILFGALAGGLYESLEVEEYVAVEGNVS